MSSTVKCRARLGSREQLHRDNPRARLRRHGPGSLTTAELLALVFGTVDQGPSALEVATSILHGANGSLRALGSRPSGMFRRAGVSSTQAAAVQAVCELGKRYASEHRAEGHPIRTAGDIFAYYAPWLEDLPAEEFHVALLDGKHRIERDICVSRGLVNSSLVHPRETFRDAIVENACAVVLVHNHPSGDPEPSPQDVTITAELVAAGQLVGIPVLDPWPIS